MLDLGTEQKVLLEHAGVCVGELPASYGEMNRMLWDAFNRGRQVERGEWEKGLKVLREAEGNAAR